MKGGLKGGLKGGVKVGLKGGLKAVVKGAARACSGSVAFLPPGESGSIRLPSEPKTSSSRAWLKGALVEKGTG